MAANANHRPANRPSRRGEIVSAAASLLATDIPEQVSVADIAKRAGLTSAAIYYHFRSRDELVDEIVTCFAEEWTAVLTRELERLTSLDQLADFVNDHFRWIEANTHQATVYFVSSIGATLASETVRRETRYALTRVATDTVQRLGSGTSTLDVTIRALGLVTMVEVCAADALRPSSAFEELGPAKFRAAVTTMARKLFA